MNKPKVCVLLGFHSNHNIYYNRIYLKYMENFGGKFMNTRHIHTEPRTFISYNETTETYYTELESHKSLVNNVPAFVCAGPVLALFASGKLIVFSALC